MKQLNTGIELFDDRDQITALLLLSFLFVEIGLLLGFDSSLSERTLGES